ncbi:hypothetical protein ACFWHW_12600 [Streptomyces pharetrae]|uniref:hypothetical protein n=1 Tax=Streptomyces pharetrae TaxID=291370 RepID=UPI00365382B7
MQGAAGGLADDQFDAVVGVPLVGEHLGGARPPPPPRPGTWRVPAFVGGTVPVKT